MNSMRIRKPFAGAFVALCLVSAYLGLAQNIIPRGEGRYLQHSDKGLHFISFFLLTLTFYWIFETTRRRVLHITLAVCTAGLACGSEFLQGAIPNNGRDFDAWDILANVIGSLAALGLCAWYHRRMLERKRASKGYGPVPGDEETGGGDGMGDVELTEGMGPQESGTTESAKDMSRELDDWDENAADDWDEPEPTTTADAAAPVAGDSNGAAHNGDPIKKDKRDD